MAGKNDPRRGPAEPGDGKDLPAHQPILDPQRLDRATPLEGEPDVIHMINPDSLRGHTQESLAQAAETLDTNIENLPPTQRLIALLGFTKNAEAKYLPTEFAAARVTFPRHKLADARRVIEEFALLVNPKFFGNPNDPQITLEYIVPNNLPTSNNHLNIIDQLDRLNMKFTTAIAQNEPIVIRTKGQGLNLLGADFSLEENHGPKKKTKDLLVDTPFEAGDYDGEEPVPLPLDQPTHYSTESSYRSAKEETINIPRKGSCSYLMIKDDFVDKIDRMQNRGGETNPAVSSLLIQLKAIYASKKFSITRQDGYILIVNASERGGAYLTGFATSLFLASRGEIKALVGSGKVVHSKEKGRPSFSIEGTLPSTAETSTGSEVSELGTGMYVHKDMYDPEAKRLKARDGGQYHTEAVAVKEGGNWLRLRKHEPSVTLVIGGPDKFIGYEEELTILNSSLNDENTRLTILKAAAGMGKSRLLAEAAKSNPSMIVLSIDPSGKTVEGSGLVKVAEQLMQYVKKNIDFNTPEARKMRDAVTQFNSMPHPQRLKLAQNKPRELVDLCRVAFRFLENNELGSIKVVLDDVHHIDSHSDSHLMALMASLIEGDSKNKVVLSMRPEERYKSKAQKTLEAHVKTRGKEAGKNIVKNVTLEGLDFSNEKVAYDFIYHSLPEEFRKGKKLGGDWWKKLGKMADKWPLAMTTFMDAIMAKHDTLTKENKPSVLTAPENEIMLSDQFMEYLETKIPRGDIDKYARERLSELPDHLKTFMYSIALLGGSVNAAQLRKIKAITGDISDSDLDFVLIMGRYIIQRRGRYELQNQIVVGSTVDSMSDQERIDLSIKISVGFANDADVSEDVKLALLHNVASQAGPEAKNFWTVYGKKVSDSFADARGNKAYGKSYGTAMAVFGMPLAEIDNLPVGEMTTMQKELAFIDGRIPQGAKDGFQFVFALSALEALGSGAMMLGKFDEAQLAFEKFERGLLKSPSGRLEFIQSAVLNMFQLAYLQKDIGKMREILATKVESSFQMSKHNGIKAVMELQLAYIEAFRSGGNKDEGVQEVMKLYSERSADINSLKRQEGNNDAYGAYLEISRLVHGRVPMELIRDEAVSIRLSEDQKRSYGRQKAGLTKPERAELLRQMGNKKLDEDMLFHRGVLDSRQLTKLMEIDGLITKLTEQQAQYPSTLSPHAGMSLLDMKAQIAGMLGRHQEAVEMFAEYWRQADQMGMHAEAARAAKMKGDIQMVQALAGHNPTLSRNNINRSRALEAVRTYSEEGVKSLTSVDPKSFYQESIRINRIRAIGALAMSYSYDVANNEPKSEEVNQMTEEFKPHLEMALRDFDYLNQNSHQNAGDAECQYCIMGYLGHIFKFARERGLALPDLKDASKYPYASDVGLAKAVEFSKKIDDNPKVDLGEKARKLAGVEAMKEFVGLEMSL